MTKVLLLSYNPVPTEEKKTVEGSGLRFWRMGIGLKNAGIEKVTLGVWFEFDQGEQTTQDMDIVSYDGSEKRFKEIMEGYDAVVFSAAMGDLSTIILNSIPKKALAIADAYSPVYVEFLTKSLDEKGDAELLVPKHYNPFVDAFNECLVRADYILIGNENQKHFYRGVVGALGGLLYHDDSRLITLPAFVEKSKNKKKADSPQNASKISVLWFGGIYPWFDIKDIIFAFSDKNIAKLGSLTIVGGSNPFYPKDNKRFNGKYIEAVDLCKRLKIKDDVVIFDDWVEYDERVNIFEKTDLAISINTEYIENEYSFRLRVADLSGNGVPILTNGGDPLGNLLLEEGVAFKLDTKNRDTIKHSLERVLKDKQSIKKAKALLDSEPLYSKLHIYEYTKHLAEVIKSNKKSQNRSTQYSTIGKILRPENAVVDNKSTDKVEINLASISTRKLVKLVLVRAVRIAKIQASKIRRKHNT